jgi:hypothetical protein
MLRPQSPFSINSALSDRIRLKENQERNTSCLWQYMFLMMRCFDFGAYVTGHGHGTTKHGKRMPEGQLTECLRWASTDKHPLASPVSAFGFPKE